MNIIETIKSKRKSLNLTQKEVSDMIGTPRTHYLRIENGNHSPTLSTLEKIFIALDIKIQNK